MTGFHEVRFPDNIAYGATGGPEFATTVVATGSGHEKRNVNWSEARGRWDVASGLKKQVQIDELIAFFRARRGRAYGFRFKDWTDYNAVGQLLGTGDDAQTQFQLVKHYPSGSVIELRTITKPVAGTVKVYLNGALQLSGWFVDTGRHEDGGACGGVNLPIRKYQPQRPLQHMPRFIVRPVNVQIGGPGVRPFAHNQDVPTANIAGEPGPAIISPDGSSFACCAIWSLLLDPIPQITLLRGEVMPIGRQVSARRQRAYPERGERRVQRALNTAIRCACPLISTAAGCRPQLVRAESAAGG
jgi:uncharacterized protein (TIGR02217 family)